MKIKYTEEAAADLSYIAAYYTYWFPEGRKKGMERIRHSIALMRARPTLAAIAIPPDIRKYKIPRTPFSIYYRAHPNLVELLRVWDSRRNIDHLLLNDSELK